MKRIPHMKFTIPIGVLAVLCSTSIALPGSQAQESKTATSRILYFESSSTSRQDTIVITDSDGTNRTTLDTATGSALTADWSRDGCRILYKLGNRSGGNSSISASLYLTIEGRSNPSALAGDVDNTPENGVQSYFSPDGSKIVFVSRSSDIMVVSSDGSGVKKLTDHLYAFQPSWSPDGSKILFMTNGLPHRIRVMNPDGTNLQDIGGGSDAQWSPDGSKIMFVQNQPGHTEIALMRPDGKDVTVLTNGSGVVLHPSWSPDGSKIAFQSVSQDDVSLEVMDVDGTHRTKVADHMVFEAELGWQASWSPDGASLTLSRTPFSMLEMATQMAAKGIQAISFDVYTVGADGTNLRKITNSGMALHPKWSPNATCQQTR